MNRLWIGIGVLTVLLAMGIGLLFVSLHFHEEFSHDLKSAGHSAMAGNWADAEKQLAQGREKWQTYQRFLAASTDHEPVEQIQQLFSQLEIFQNRQMDVEFASACFALAELSEVITETHNLRWWSIL